MDTIVIMIMCVKMGKTNTKTRIVMEPTIPTGRTRNTIMITSTSLLLDVNQDKIVKTLVMTTHRARRRGTHQVEGEDLDQE